MYYCTTYKNASEEHLWHLLVVVKGDLCSTAKLFSVSITAATAAQLSPP